MKKSAKKRIWKIAISAIATVSILQSGIASVAIDIRQPPSSAQRAALIEEGWESARDQIAKGLAQGYIPSRYALAGSTQNSAFVSWLNLWQWFNLFSKPPDDFLERYIRQHIVVNQGGGFVILQSGVEMPAGLHFLNDEEWGRLAPQSASIAKEKLGIEAAQNTKSIGDLVGKDFANVLISDDSFSRMFFETLSDRDYLPGVLENLKSIWAANPQQYKTYQNLALALAIVFDQPPPAYWPHYQVAQEAVPREDISLTDRFKFWVESNESRRTVADIRRLSASQLKFVVDALVSRSELEWAQKNARFSRVDFGRAFSSIRYDQSRLKQQQYIWPGKEYTLEAIRKNGGICVDQAYFAMLSGKALGLPTLFFTGQGSDGGHAWLGYLKSDDRWDMDCGRYSNQNYVVGEALDPQTWLPINDHELSYLSAHFRESAAFSASFNELAMARLLDEQGNSAGALKALDGAISVCPTYAEAWQAKTDFLRRSGATPEVLKAHLEAALHQFNNNEDIRTIYQKELASLARSQGDEKAAASYETQIVQRNRSRRSDISVSTTAEKLSTLVKAAAAEKSNPALREQKFNEAYSQYHNLIIQLNHQGGGNLYYEVVRPYVLALIEAGDLQGAKRAIELASRSLHPEGDSILANEFRELEGKLKAATARN